ncbi:MAG TPA: 3-hydroxyacyl-CoA dehydrogenase NAD-binding domain-containing protein [Steroidobacteraceae bacterium]
MSSANTGVRTVGIIGAGTMGSGIAVSCATGGLEVVLIDTQAAALESGVRRSHAIIEGAVKKGRLASAAGTAARARIGTATEMATLAAVDLVIEAVFENLQLKQTIFRALDANCAPGTLLATNTSTLDIDAIAAATARPQDVVGMHFFSPANVMPLVEIVRGAETSSASIATALDVTRQIGKIGVVVGNCFGFVGNRMLYAYGRENQLMLLEGVTAQRIDVVLETFGMAMGPNAVGDLAGLDVGYRVRRERKDLPDDPRYFRVADLLVENGRLGQKSGRGMYRYGADKRAREVDPEVDPLIRAEAARLGVVARATSDAQILERCLYALINEGAAILGAGIAASAEDIDTIWCNGYGFPRARGGPMAYADTVGLGTVYDGVRRLAAVHGPRYWTADSLLADLGSRGSSFAAWSAQRASIS